MRGGRIDGARSGSGPRGSCLRDTVARGLLAAVAVVAAGAGAVAAGDAAPAFVDPVDGARIAAAWRVVAWPEQKAPPTRYRVAAVDGGGPAAQALRIDADASYGNLVLALDGVAAPRELAWSWRVTQANAQADLATKAGDDAPAKVCLAFDLPLERVPLLERTLLRLARSRSAEPLPAATLCWVWGGDEAVGTRVDNPYSRRVRQIVLRRRGDADGRWFAERRDVAADFRRTFGDESATPPPVVAAIVAGDADNTGARSVAEVAALRWLP